MMFYAQSKAKGHIRMKQNVFLPQVTILIHNLHIFTVEDWRNFLKNLSPQTVFCVSDCHLTKMLSIILFALFWWVHFPCSVFFKVKTGTHTKSHTQHVHIYNTYFILYVFWRDSPKLLLCAEKQLKQQKKIIANNENHEQQQMKKCSNDTPKI